MAPRERIATTYGYAWLDAHVGPDDRLRGGWTACDGAAGRMTAQNGLHNLPTSLRSAIAAHPGHVFVGADLGQIEPRVLAAVSGDRAFAAATRADDLYAPVAASLGVERAVAKVAVLAAMYGQRSGAAGEALRGLERAYPAAMAYLDRAYAAGVRRQPLRTFGGRAIPLGRVLVSDGSGGAARGDARGEGAAPVGAARVGAARGWAQHPSARWPCRLRTRERAMAPAPGRGQAGTSAGISAQTSAWNTAGSSAGTSARTRRVTPHAVASPAMLWSRVPPPSSSRPGRRRCAHDR